MATEDEVTGAVEEAMRSLGIEGAIVERRPEVWGCSNCGAFSRGDPPHGWGEPCPLKREVDLALIRKLDAERVGMQRQLALQERMAAREEDD